MGTEIRIIRSARKSISMCVSSENEVTVRCPKLMSQKRIQEFIDSKQQWLKNVLDANSAKLSKNKDIISFKAIYIGGEKLPLVISDKNSITPTAVYVKDIKSIKRTLIKELSASFIKYAQMLSTGFNLIPAGFAVKAYKSRWGCCDSKGLITFNFVLFMLPKELQRYVIIHELCHMVYFNHSAQFWRLVAGFESDYKELRRRLKDFDFLTKLY